MRRLPQIWLRRRGRDARLSPVLQQIIRVEAKQPAFAETVVNDEPFVGQAPQGSRTQANQLRGFLGGDEVIDGHLGHVTSMCRQA